MSERIEVNDRVQFQHKGQAVSGTVTAVRSHRPGSRHALAKALGLATPRLLRMDVVDTEGRLWQVPERMLSKLPGRGDAAARSKAAATYASRDAHTRAAADTRWAAASAAGLDNLKRGDAVEVQFGDGSWRPAVFSHMAQSGKVGFTVPNLFHRPTKLEEDFGAAPRPLVRFVAPKFVRLPGGAK